MANNRRLRQWLKHLKQDLSESDKDGHDVNYLFGQVNISKPMIDWAVTVNLTAAVGACY